MQGSAQIANESSLGGAQQPEKAMPSKNLAFQIKLIYKNLRVHTRPIPIQLFFQTILLI